MTAELFRSFFNCEGSAIGEIVILTCFDRFEDFKLHFKKYTAFEFEGYYKGITFESENKKISVIHTANGAASVGDAVLALSETPCRAVIYTGTAGGIGEGINIGDLVIPERAAAGDGFSPYYLEDFSSNHFENIVFAAGKMTGSFDAFMEQKASRLKSKVHHGCIYTIGSLFAETEDRLKAIEKNGCSSIDMETSAFFTAAAKINRGSLAIHYVTDLPQKAVDLDMLKKSCLRIYTQIPGIIADYVSLFYDEIIRCNE